MNRLTDKQLYKIWEIKNKILQPMAKRNICKDIAHNIYASTNATRTTLILYFEEIKLIRFIDR